ncbi:hypothetical protein [Methylomagnum sp.]
MANNEKLERIAAAFYNPLNLVADFKDLDTGELFSIPVLVLLVVGDEDGSYLDAHLLGDPIDERASKQPGFRGFRFKESGEAARPIESDGNPVETAWIPTADGGAVEGELSTTPTDYAALADELEAAGLLDAAPDEQGGGAC